MADGKDPLAVEIGNTVSALASRRAEYETLWNSIVELVIPRRYRITEVVGGGHKNERRILDSTAQVSAEIFTSFLFTALCNPTVNWVPLSVVDDGGPRADPGTEEAAWLETVSKVIKTHLEAPTVGIYAALHEVFFDLATFGTAVLYLEMDPNGSTLRALHCNVFDCYLDVGESGRVDRLFRKCYWTPRQMRQRWPDGRDLGKSVSEPGADDPSLERVITVIHAVFPSTDKHLVDLLPAGSDRGRMGPFVSVWINEKDNKVIDVGRYEEFPYVVTRWYTTGSQTYGRSPAMSVLGDIFLVNEMAHAILKGVARLVDPPWLFPYGSIVGGLRTFPGAISYSDGNVAPQPLVPPGGSRIEYGQDFLQQRQEAIRRGFFNPLILGERTPVQTATAVLADQDERNRATGPMVHRLKGELFDALVARVAGLLWRAGHIPPPPASFDPRRARLAYRDPISASADISEGLALMRLLETLGPWSQALGPTVFDGINAGRLGEKLFAASGAPPSVANTGAEIRKLKAAAAARSEQEALAQQATQVAPALQAVAALKKADK